MVRADQLDLTNPTQPGRYGLIAMNVARADVNELAGLWETLCKQTPRDWPSAELVMLRWTALDPAGALAAAEKNGDQAGDQACAWRAWARHAPDAALAAARSSEFKPALSYVLLAIAKSNPDRAHALIAEFPNQGTAFYSALAAGLCAEERFEEAMEMERKSSSMSSETLRAWAAKDPEAALHWLQENSLGANGLREKMLFDALLFHHPEKAQALLESLPPGSLRYRFQEAQINSLAASDPERATELARAEVSPSRKAALLASVGRALVDSDPIKALELLREISSAAEIKDSAMISRHPGGSTSTGSSGGGGAPIDQFFKELAEVKPRETMAAAQELAAKSGAPQLIYRAASIWSDRDRDGLIAWLPSYEAGPKRDAVIVMSVLQKTGPQSALSDFHQAAAALPLIQQQSALNVTGRNGSLNSFLGNWQRRDAEDFRRYLAGSDVPEIVRQAVANNPSLQP